MSNVAPPSHKLVPGPGPLAEQTSPQNFPATSPLDNILVSWNIEGINVEKLMLMED